MGFPGLLIALLMSAALQLALSAPASPFPVTVSQPDGTTFKVVQKGDEWVNWFETVEGYPVVKDEATGVWYYALPSGSELIPTPYRVGEVIPEAVGVPRGVKLYPANPTLRSQAIMGVGRPPLPHTQRVLVILVDFDDMPGNTGLTTGSTDPNEMKRIFFEESTEYTVAHYFNTVSNGKLRIAPAYEIYGAPDGVVGWLRLYQNHPKCQDLSDINCILQLVRDALAAADPHVDFAAYDTNNDGVISPHELAVVIVVAGYESAIVCNPYNEYDERVWAHMFSFSFIPGANPPMLDGKSVPYYAMFGEKHCINTTSGSTVVYPATIGIIIHELAHLILGLPDLYDTDDSSEGIGPLGVMGSGLWGRTGITEFPGTRPVFPTAWTMAVTGFMSLTEADPSTGSAELRALARSDRNALKVLTNSPTEYFIVSLRIPKEGTYDEGLKGLGLGIFSGGVAIWHVDTSGYPDCVNQNNCNNNESRKMLDLEEADGKQDLDVSNGIINDNDLFTTASGRNRFAADTNPSSRLYSGADSGVEIRVLHLDRNTMRAVVSLIAGAYLTGGSSSGGFGCGSLSPVQSAAAFAPLLLLIGARLIRRLI